MSDLRDLIPQVRKAIGEIESHLDADAVSPTALEEFKMAIDSLRTQVLAMLTAPAANDYDTFVRAFRLQRADQVCQNVMAGLIDGSIDAETPGLENLDETLRVTAAELDRVLTTPS